MKPGAEATFAAIRSNLPHQMDKNILSQIFRLSRIPHHLKTNRVYLPVMLFVENAQRVQIAIRYFAREQKIGI